MTPFSVDWTRHSFAPVRDAVGRYRFPPAPAEDGWRYGCDPAFLRRLCAYWADGFDVEACATVLNRYPQVIVRVEDLDIHAVHVVGEAAGRRPLLLVTAGRDRSTSSGR